MGHQDANRASEVRLSHLASEMTSHDLRRSGSNGWTAVSLLHLAFWDRFVLQRWRRAIAAGDLTRLRSRTVQRTS